MPQLTETQKIREQKFYDLLSRFCPRFYRPLWLVRLFSDILPGTCPFERTIFYKDRLILFVPQLCVLNPFYYAIMDFRLKDY